MAPLSDAQRAYLEREEPQLATILDLQSRPQVFSVFGVPPPRAEPAASSAAAGASPAADATMVDPSGALDVHALQKCLNEAPEVPDIASPNKSEYYAAQMLKDGVLRVGKGISVIADSVRRWFVGIVTELVDTNEYGSTANFAATSAPFGCQLMEERDHVLIFI